MATTGNLDTKPVTLNEARKFVKNVSAHARGGNTLKATKTGNLISVDDAYAGALLGLTVYGNSVQDGTPTPENPVAIKSVAGGHICTTGENMLYRYQASGNTSTVTGVTATWNDDNSITLTGTNTSSSWAEITVMSNTQRMVLTTGETYSMGLFGNTNDDIDIVVRKNTTSGGAYDGTTSTHKSFTANVTAYAVVKVRVRGNATVNNTVYPYLVSGSTAPTKWPTIYLVDASTTPLTLVDDQGVAHELRRIDNDWQDRLIINADGSGTLKARTGKGTFDGESNWEYSTSYGFAMLDIRNIANHRSPTAYGYLTLSDLYEASLTQSSLASLPDNHIYFSTSKASSVPRIYVKDTTHLTDTDTVKSWFNAHPITVVFPIAETTYHIPAINMPALPDLVSNAWVSATDADGAAIACECGVTYRRDINKVVADIEEAIADIVSA